MSADPMAALERELRELGADLGFPPAPDLAARVRARIEPQRRRGWPALRVLAVSFALLLLGAGTVLAASPDARDAVLRFLRIRGATVERVDRLPAAEPRDPFLGERVSAEDAAGALRADLRIPAALGAPDAVFVMRADEGDRVTLAYRPREGSSAEGRWGLLVTELRAGADPEYVKKVAGRGTVIDAFSIDGRRAIWVGGRPHVVAYRAPDGSIVPDTVRLAGNVLLMEHGRLLLRFEGDLGKDEMVRIARSVE